MALGALGTIPIPTYLLNDDELYMLIDRIEACSFESEATELVERDKAAIHAMELELKKRSRPIRLRDVKT